MTAPNSLGTVDLSGMTLRFGPADTRGSDNVFLTRILSDGSSAAMQEGSLSCFAAAEPALQAKALAASATALRTAMSGETAKVRAAIEPILAIADPSNGVVRIRQNAFEAGLAASTAAQKAVAAMSAIEESSSRISQIVEVIEVPMITEESSDTPTDHKPDMEMGETCAAT